jgi:hypothetical protein
VTGKEIIDLSIMYLSASSGIWNGSCETDSPIPATREPRRIRNEESMESELRGEPGAYSRDPVNNGATPPALVSRILKQNKTGDNRRHIEKIALRNAPMTTP